MLVHVFHAPPPPPQIILSFKIVKQIIRTYILLQSKFTKLAVPDAILPTSLAALVTSLTALREEAASLKLRADDVALAREARDTFIRLRR